MVAFETKHVVPATNVPNRLQVLPSYVNYFLILDAEVELIAVILSVSKYQCVRNEDYLDIRNCHPPSG